MKVPIRHAKKDSIPLSNLLLTVHVARILNKYKLYCLSYFQCIATLIHSQLNNLNFTAQNKSVYDAVLSDRRFCLIPDERKSAVSCVSKWKCTVLKRTFTAQSTSRNFVLLHFFFVSFFFSVFLYILSFVCLSMQNQKVEKR